MASNKNQHFVPRCHLRPFTKDEGDAAINVFNIDRRKFIPNAPVKHQCSGDYFYGKDELLEAAIRSVEGAYGSTLRAIREPGYVLTDEHKTILKCFWLLQYLRTEAASRRSVERAAEFDKVAGVEALSFRFGIRQAVQVAMRSYADMMGTVDDLKVCLIRNRSAAPFITSDDPAILTNRWYLEDHRIVGRSFGLQASGMLALLPLTPRLLCVAYDGDVYSVQHQDGFVDTRSVRDVRALNQHQFLNCFANVFVHDLEHADESLSELLVAASHRLQSRHTIHVAVLDRTEEEYSRYRVVSPGEALDGDEALLHSEVKFPKLTAWPSLIRWRQAGSVYTNGTGLKYVRREFALSLQSHRAFWREPAR